MLIKPTKEQRAKLKKMVSDKTLPYNIKTLLYRWFFEKRTRFNIKTIKQLKKLGCIELTEIQEQKIALNEKKTNLNKQIKRIMG